MNGNRQTVKDFPDERLLKHKSRLAKKLGNSGAMAYNKDLGRMARPGQTMECRRLGDYGGGLQKYGLNFVRVSSRRPNLYPGTSTQDRMNSFTSSKANSSSSPMRGARLFGRALASHSRR
jgi:hypothetical protein